MDTVAKYDIVGRDRELAALRAELAAAMQGAGRLVLVTGEAGIGKTALLTAHAREARARGALVAWGRCHEMPGAPAYWPWLRLIEDLVLSEELPDARSDDLRALRDGLRTAASREATTPGESDRFELFARIARSLSAVARKRGLVLALDDVHWADAASVELLRFLAAELASDALLMIATLRSHEPASESTLTGLARLAQSFPLGPLEREAVEALLVERIPLTIVPATEVRTRVVGDDGEGFVEEVWRRSGGNPFFVLELAQLLRAGGHGATAETGAAALPFAIKRVVGQRLDRLPAHTLDLLQAASIIGREFDVSLLASVLERSAAELRAELLPVVEYGLLQSSIGQPDRLAFVHALVREVLYESIEEARAAALHGRIGLALEALSEADPASWQQAEQLPALAHHFHRALYGAAADSAARTRAADYAWRTGAHLLDLMAYEEAAVHFERALALLPEASAEPHRVEVGIRLGQALVGLGDRTRAESILEKALGEAEIGADPRLFAEATLAWSAARAEIGTADLAINERLESALTALPAEDSTLRAQLLALLSLGLHLVRGTEDRRRALAAEALAMARRLGDAATLASVQIGTMTLLAGPDDLDERLAAIDAMLESCAGNPTAELHALSAKIDACAEAGDRIGLDLALDAFDEKARVTRHPYFHWLGASHHAALALLEGRYEDAEELVARALQLGERAQSQTPGLHFAQQMFMLRAWQNRMDEVAPLVEGGAETARIVPAWRCALADLYEHLGRRVEARREFDAVLQGGCASLPRDTTWLTSVMLLAAVCPRFEDRASGETLYRLLQPYAGRVAVASPLIVTIAPVDMRLGHLATQLGRFDDAERHLARARALAESMRAPTWKAEIRYLEARLYQAQGEAGDEQRAVSCLDDAQAIASSVGMALLLTWIEDARSAPPGTRAASELRFARFARDGEGFTLVFEGRTTRLRAMVGLSHVRALLAQPDRELHVLDLARPGSERGDAPALGDAGPLLDARARAAYTERGRELQSELAEAEASNDQGRRQRITEELEFLTAELERAFGLGGRERRGGAASERARVSVTRAIKYATRKIAEHNPVLADHLERSIRTGAFCIYAPAARDRVDWSL